VDFTTRGPRPPPCSAIHPSTAPRVWISQSEAGNPGNAGVPLSTRCGSIPKDFKLEFENSQVRVLRVNMGPRQSVPMHEYTLNHLVVYFTDQNVRETSPEERSRSCGTRRLISVGRPLQTEGRQPE